MVLRGLFDPQQVIESSFFLLKFPPIRPVCSYYPSILTSPAGQIVHQDAISYRLRRSYSQGNRMVSSGEREGVNEREVEKISPIFKLKSTLYCLNNLSNPILKQIYKIIWALEKKINPQFYTDSKNVT